MPWRSIAKPILDGKRKIDNLSHFFQAQQNKTCILFDPEVHHSVVFLGTFENGASQEKRVLTFEKL